MTQTPRKNQGFGRSLAMTPGVRTIPAAMVLPTAAAMPNHTPRTCNNFPGEILPRGKSGVATGASALGGTSEYSASCLVRWYRDRGDNNRGDWKYKAQVMATVGKHSGTGGWFSALLRTVRTGNTELAPCCHCPAQRARRYGL